VLEKNAAEGIEVLFTLPSAAFFSSRPRADNTSRVAEWLVGGRPVLGFPFRKNWEFKERDWLIRFELFVS
jgi:hypothetical protein